MASSYASTLLIFWFLRCRIIHLYLGLRLQRAQRLVTSYYDLVALLQPLSDLNVRYPGNPGLHRPEHRFFPATDQEYTLHFILLGIARCCWWTRRQCHARGLVVLGLFRSFLKVLAGPYSQRLDGDRHHIFLFRRTYFRRSGKSGPQVIRRIRERHYHLKIFGFLHARRA